MNAVADATPEVIVHELTSIPANLDPRKFDEQFAITNRLRTEGADNLIAGGRAVGVRRIVAQSYAGWPYARVGGAMKTEEDPLDSNPPAAMRGTLEAIRYLEAAVTGASGFEGVVLRYGSLYGPGNTLGEGGAMLDQVRHRKIPVIGGGTGVWSFIQIEDAARATALAVGRGAPGIYNIADNDPSPVSEWLPALAAIVGAKPPLRIPAWLARLLIGEVGVMMMTQTRGVSNAKAKRGLQWEPLWATWREGFRKAL